MKSREKEIMIWLNDKEYDHLKKAVTRSGLSMQAYLRQLLNDLVPQDLPPPEFQDVLNELYKIAEAYRLLVTIAVTNGIDTQELQTQYKALCQAIDAIDAKYYMPLPIDKGKVIGG